MRKRLKRPILRPKRVYNHRCPLCPEVSTTRSRLMLHIAKYHLPEENDMVEDALSGFFAGVPDYARVAKQKARTIKEIMELERIYRLPSGKVRRIHRGERK